MKWFQIQLAHNLVAAIVSPFTDSEVHWSHWLRHPLLSVQKQLLKFFKTTKLCPFCNLRDFANVFEVSSLCHLHLPQRS